jgi:hypothetical protein
MHHHNRNVQANTGKAHALAAVVKLPGSVLLHAGQGVVESTWEEDVLVGLGGEVAA